MPGLRDLRLFRRRPPRWVFWILGAAIAFIGAYVARGLSEQVPMQARWPFWFLGTVFIFSGLYVLSQGTRSRDRSGQEDGAEDP